MKNLLTLYQYFLSFFRLVSLVIFSFLITQHNIAGAQSTTSYKYEPTVVTLSGLLASERGAIPDGKVINYPAIYLQKPINVIADPKNQDGINVTEKDVRSLQLSLDETQMQSYKKLKGQQVTITGTLFHSISGHHYTKVLLSVTAIKPKKPELICIPPEPANRHVLAKKDSITDREKILEKKIENAYTEGEVTLLHESNALRGWLQTVKNKEQKMKDANSDKLSDSNNGELEKELDQINEKLRCFIRRFTNSK